MSRLSKPLTAATMLLWNFNSSFICLSFPSQSGAAPNGAAPRRVYAPLTKTAPP